MRTRNKILVGLVIALVIIVSLLLNSWDKLRRCDPQDITLPVIEKEPKKCSYVTTPEKLPCKHKGTPNIVSLGSVECTYRAQGFLSSKYVKTPIYILAGLAAAFLLYLVIRYLLRIQKPLEIKHIPVNMAISQAKQEIGRRAKLYKADGKIPDGLVVEGEQEVFEHSSKNRFVQVEMFVDNPLFENHWGNKTFILPLSYGENAIPQGYMNYRYQHFEEYSIAKDRPLAQASTRQERALEALNQVDPDLAQEVIARQAIEPSSISQEGVEETPKTGEVKR